MRSPGRPVDPAIDVQLLRVTQDLLIEEGFERLTMDAVARRSGASKATIYRRWTGKTALVVAAAAALFHAPELPDTGDLREDLLACGRAYVESEGRTAQVLASVISASRHDHTLREALLPAIGEPYTGLFQLVLSRQAQRGLVRDDLDLALLAQVFPALAYHKVAALGLLVSEDDVVRAVDAILLPALGLQPSTRAPRREGRTKRTAG